MELDYVKDIRIDETALDIEWLEQASLAMKYGKNFAQCRRTLVEIEEEIKVIRAELIARANKLPVKCCGKDKPNAADIEAYYRNHSRHKEAKERWVEAQYNLDMAEIAKNEISFTRKAALENLVRLHGQQYFAGPEMPRDLNWERKEIEKKTNAGTASKMQRNKT